MNTRNMGLFMIELRDFNWLTAKERMDNPVLATTKTTAGILEHKPPVTKLYFLHPAGKL